ncbi:UNVERIFIED_CONTAM: hypothetical protein RMT77_006264 [Armadillidium vulgare]
MNVFNVILTLLIFKVCGSRFSKADIYRTNDELRKKLLKNYDKHSLPHIDVNGTTSVKFNMDVRRIFLDDKTQVFTLHSWVAMTWVDDRLKWDYKDYGGLKLTYFGDAELWKPDIYVYNK